jgi:DNA-binding response OmpR family regulator
MPTIPYILVIDDEPGILEITAEILEYEGYQVEKAANGQEGLQILSQVHPELVMLDMRMPVLDGWGFAKVLHNTGSTVPILVLTAALDAKRWAEEINADAYLGKPFDLNELLAVVEQVLKRP